MSQTIVARATSLAASTGLLALAIAGALSISTVVTQTLMPEGPTVTSYVDPPPYVPPVAQPHAPPPVQRTVIDNSAPPAPTADQPPAQPTTPVAFNPPAPPGPPTITNPRWLQTPRDLARYYPNRAQAMGVEGSATLDCLVDISGRLACAIVAESPTGWNFGAAALRIARDYRMAPATQGGQAVQGHYRMRVPFEIPR